VFSLPSYATRQNFQYETFFALVGIHILALAAPFTFTWAGLVAFLILTYVSAGLGITIGYHRLLTHGSFQTNKPVKYLLTLCACLALQGGPIFWVATHRFHHKESDQELDPHSPRESFLWAHVIWNFFRHPRLKDYENMRRLTLDLHNDLGLLFFQKYFFVIYLLSAVILFLGGYLWGGLQLGISLLVWGVCLRTVYVWHVTWLVNSATHKWGYRNYKVKDNSVNSWWVALLTFGEGWHNNHHSDQRSAKFGHRWFEVDVTFALIRMLEVLGLAHNVVRPRYKRVSSGRKLTESYQS
jgi:fatty-acid desaturase